MSVEQIDKIDAISITKENIVELTISDHLEWDEENNHLFVLQNKINAYIDFIQNGQILEHYPKVKNKEITIKTVFKYKPNEDALIFLYNCAKFLETFDLEFKWQTIEN